MEALEEATVATETGVVEVEDFAVVAEGAGDAVDSEIVVGVGAVVDLETEEETVGAVVAHQEAVTSLTSESLIKSAPHQINVLNLIRVN